VSTVTVTADEGVKSYQTVLPMARPPQSNCSPVSFVATIVLLASVYGGGETVIAFPKLSFAGVVPQTMFRVRSPGGTSTEPICIQYVCPEVAANWTAEVNPVPTSSLQATWKSAFKLLPV
jgi:hypothetical protein